jgi:miniconductance mechanosensitive channel
MLKELMSWLAPLNLNAGWTDFLARTIAIVLILILSAVLFLITRKLVAAGFRYLIRRTETTRDDFLLERRIFSKLSHLVPALSLYVLLPMALEGHEELSSVARSLVLIYMILAGVIIVDSLLGAAQDIYETFDVAKEIHIKAFVQILKVGIYFLGFILVVSVVVNKTPLYLLSGLGALTAVLMLIFKDSILGFVAGIQLIANKMVSKGDWIEMPKYGADGDVLDIALTTVKVQNWDKTITTIPTYALISESFKNWRGMKESGGRRIKRSIYLDMNTIKFCDEDMLERFSKIQFIREYIDRKKAEIAAFNRELHVDDSCLVNGRKLTNVGTFRAYVEAYLRNHPQIHQRMTFLVRQIAPSPEGVPLEIYVFCRDTVWANYEAIQADIFDHLLAVIPEFDLRAFQSPGGGDLEKLGSLRGTSA